MTNRRTVLCCAALAVLQPCLVLAEPAELYRNAFAQAIEWFRSLYKPVVELAQGIDQIRLATYLIELGNSFESMVVDKREIALLLDTESSDAELAQLRQKANDLMDHVKQARERIRAVSFRLKTAYRDQGLNVAEALSEALLGGKAWLPQLMDRTSATSRQDLTPEARQQYAEHARASATALSMASADLAKLVDFTRHQAT